MDFEEAVLYRLACGLAEVLCRLAVPDEAGREIVREGCKDAAAGRRPRW